MREEADLLLACGGYTELIQNLIRAFPGRVKIGSHPGASVRFYSREPRVEVSKRLGQRSLGVCAAAAVTGRGDIQGLVGSPMPIIVVAHHKAWIVRVWQSTIMAADSCTVKRDRLLQTSDGGRRIAHLDPQSTGAKVVVSLCALGIVELSRGRDGADQTLVVLKIVAHHVRCVVRIRPGAHPGNRQAG